jgi:hypothetical protein
MREIGLPKLQSWRWAPCAAFVLGSLSFVTFALVAIPDHIGHVDPESTTSSLRFGGALARTQPPTTPQGDWSGDTTNTASATPSPGVRSMQPSLVTQDADGAFPKRGFTPPLERPEPPPAPPALPTPAQQQPQLNVPPPVPAPPPPAADSPPAAAPVQPEVMPQATPVPAPPAGDASPTPAPPVNN